MARCIALDLGTTYTRIYTPEEGVVLRCPSAAAIDSSTHEVVAVGNKAKKMLGRTPDDILAYRPIKGGVVSDFEVTASMLDTYFTQKRLRSTFSRPIVLLATPYRLTEVEQLAVQNAVIEAGAKDVPHVPSIFAAAAGAGLNVRSPRGCMILNIGGGITEAAIISSGGIVNVRAAKMAGERLDFAITNYMKNARGLIIGDATAESLKVNLASMSSAPEDDRGSMIVSGLRTSTGMAVSETVTSAEIREAITSSVESISRIALMALENVPPELAADIYRYGLMVSGGTAMIPGIAEAISRCTHLRVTVARDPLDCVINGLARIMKNPRLWQGGSELEERLRRNRLF